MTIVTMIIYMEEESDIPILYLTGLFEVDRFPSLDEVEHSIASVSAVASVLAFV